ncbi:Xaa-Pro peptidase family protein [Bradyrhizobium sp. ISRA443]|uniref:M24 family metallopeptidase n=1 Tax=unclassified Bradyrhizobium TaxID=2631580 RepID=UPI002479448E|nr:MULTISPECIES: Xaa-Pro peptidase family protein [unclassified Bradyrhizobium]WGR93399.1 Xaa-Pro peptidase family protein [Bradyrhizobium sp. ISRA435]WGR97938.1 Xaa-Pro peptidase family protein [Bradyrhizobium sp. ISRA436]WGS04828.1 Xaa-Pro peptidase family protein [Bradyrhizobium sp. ISRA437]WGS11709.1 Xaa-Pro peptidase family protein [Bradyrhizobium sp. ISRA443]
MATTTVSASPLIGAAFPRSEYERRQQKAVEAIMRAELDAVLVTAHGHLRYLTGYHGFGGYFAPFPLILSPGREATYVVREYDVDAVRAEGCVSEIVPYTHQHEFPEVCADVLRRHGLAGRRVGLELGCWNLAPADVNALQAQMPDLKIADATRLIASVAAVKTELELKVMREAMAVTDLAVRTFQNSVREGVTETEVYANIAGEISKAGGELWRSFTLVFGERTKVPHGSPVCHPIRNNEPAMIEIGGLKHGYAVGLVRSAVLGRHPETESLHALSVESLEAAIAVIKPGVTAEAVDAAARNVVERSGRPRAFRHRTGYQTGIHWTERGNLSLEPNAADILEPGMTFHMPIILFSEGGHLFGCSEHVLVTERGAEILSRTPHMLYRA